MVKENKGMKVIEVIHFVVIVYMHVIICLEDGGISEITRQQ
jgi:hypothetical protein